jgi:hypothetical protein
MEEAEDLAVGFFAVVVFEDLGLDARAVLFAEVVGEGYLAVDGAGAADEAAGESDDDERRTRCRGTECGADRWC